MPGVEAMRKRRVVPRAGRAGQMEPPARAPRGWTGGMPGRSGGHRQPPPQAADAAEET